MSADAPKKVVILGGGVGALAAAFEISDAPEDRERFEVTGYQLGWRLGGKGASGRNHELGERLEDHGLHVWFGFYDNAFNVMRRCYDELRRPSGAPLATLADAFKPVHHIVLCDEVDGDWVMHDLPVPPNPLAPGGQHVLPTFVEIVRDALGALVRWWERVRSHVPGRHPDHLHVARGHAASAVGTHALHLIARLVSEFRDWLARYALPHLEHHADGRFFFTTF